MQAFLVERFEVFGTVESASVVIANQKSTGYDFVKFLAHEDALKAIQQLDGVEIGDYKWGVKSGFMKRSNSKEKDADSVNVTNPLGMNLSVSTDDTEIFEKPFLWRRCNGYGEIMEVSLCLDSFVVEMV
ncbi:RNA recognition motif domain, eukaryote, Nucleotide-binding alpha-beta plait domain protein [Artemisia annua]|uniref:RNA recognition motif domain, eukaryote, Nucleotide-binding alpha-beta plait domain protein n=1 Tax=Artemisia annua TaxID=35608 RepID=A0A2U1Q238_ARTAN|nr:RNA recognition motif domain, eukaryote, Nucleotide-binding alpha-beta plait domain protein [Artemisia annua]